MKAPPVTEDIKRQIASFFAIIDLKKQNPGNYWQETSGGHEDYRGRYLSSSSWKSFKQRFLLKNVRCACCNEAADQIHHRDYRPAVMAFEDQSMLVPVCDACHTAIHRGETKDMTHRHEVDRRLNEKVDANPHWREIEIVEAPKKRSRAGRAGKV